MLFRLLKKLGISNEMSSIIRRLIAIGFFAGVSAMIASYLKISPEYLVPVLTAILAAIDKMSRAYKK